MANERVTERVLLDAYGTGAQTAYDVEFTSIEPEDRHADYVFGIAADDANLSVASESPVDGWAAWLDGELLVAFSYREGHGIGCARTMAELGVDDEQVDFKALATAIASAILTAK
jgi:hypothetical protein